MPYEKMEDVPPQFRELAPIPGGKNKVPLTLEQTNEIAKMADGMKDNKEIDSPYAIAITNFRRMYACEGGKWIKRKVKLSEFDEIDTNVNSDTMDEIDQFAAAEEVKNEQEKRSKQYKIGIKLGGNVTKPSAYQNVSDDEFADPVNFKYPLNRSRVLPAIRYYNHEGQMEAGGYSVQEWSIIGNRIADTATKILDVDYEYKDGKIAQSEEEMSDNNNISQFAEVHEIKDFPFFKAGIHNGAKYTEEDLDRIVKNFVSLKESVKPVLKLGHGSQKFLKDEGMPAAGWVSNIKKVGTILYADITNIPKRIFELIKNKIYRRPSAEIYLDFKDEKDTKHGLTLSAIALLGADVPAIKSLPEIEALYHNEAYNSTVTCYNDNFDRNKEGLIMAEFEQENEQQKKELKDALAEVEQLKRENLDLKVKADKTDELEEEFEQLEERKKIEDASTTLKKYKESGQILPVQEAPLSALMLSFVDQDVVTYSENGVTSNLSQQELLFKALDLLPNVVEFAELSKKREVATKEDKTKQYRMMFTDKTKREETMELVGIEIAELAEKISTDQKISYVDALLVASKQLEQ